MKILEKDMEDLIIANPEKYLGEPGLKLISRQYSIGSYRFDLLFEDRHGGKLIVELQRGTLDRNHTYKILDYYDEYKLKNPETFVDLMVVANKIKRERRTRLEFHGIQYIEIPEDVFLDEISRNSSTEKPEENSFLEKSMGQREIESGQKAFDRLILRKNWIDECTKKVEMTVHRQEQLNDILSKYDGSKIPFSHFKREYINVPKHSNVKIYPLICAFHIGYFARSENSLILKEEYRIKLKEFFPQSIGDLKTDNESQNSLIRKIREQQPNATYLRYLDSSEKLQFVENIHSLITKECPLVRRKFNKKEISYIKGKKFGIIDPQKKKIIVGPLLTKFTEMQDPKRLCRDIRSKTYSFGGEVRADFENSQLDAEYAFFILKQSLDKL